MKKALGLFAGFVLGLGAVFTLAAGNHGIRGNPTLQGYAAGGTVIVSLGATAAQGGANLRAAYARAKTLTPGGSALSASNRACLLVPPGTYDMGAASLALDANFVDIAGLIPPWGTRGCVVITIDAAKPAVYQTAYDVRMSGLRIYNADTTAGGYSDGAQGLVINATPANYGSAAETASNDSSTIQIYIDLKDVRANFPVGSWVWHTTDKTWHRVTSSLYASDDTRVAVTPTATTQWDGLSVRATTGPGNYPSVYVGCEFDVALPSYGACTAYSSPVHGQSDLSGTWINCTAGSYSWRVHTGVQLIPALMRNCTAGSGSWSGNGTEEGNPNKIDGTFEECTATGSGCFTVVESGGTILQNAVFRRCVAGNNSWTSLSIAVGGTYYDCVGGTGCFVGAVGSGFSGTAYRCIVGSGSFADLRGTLVGCQVLDSATTIACAGASVRDSTIQVTTTSIDAFTLLDGNTSILNSTILVLQGGTGIPVDDDGNAWNVVVAHCRMNNAANDADGMGTNVTNLIGTPGNVVDDDLAP